MEMALRECGTPRILFAAAVSAVTKRSGARATSTASPVTRHARSTVRPTARFRHTTRRSCSDPTGRARSPAHLKALVGGQRRGRRRRHQRSRRQHPRLDGGQGDREAPRRDPEGQSAGSGSPVHAARRGPPRADRLGPSRALPTARPQPDVETAGEPRSLDPPMQSRGTCGGQNPIASR